MALTILMTATAAAAAPAPCHNTPQITDPTGDGHHSSSDVTAAWFSEASGHLQVVIQVHAGTWVPEHDDADVNGSGFAFLFTLGGQTDYLRARAAPDGTLTYDYGTYPSQGNFTSAGATTGTAVYATGGTVTMDVPDALGATAGSVLASPYVLTYDGIVGGVPTWVDHGPGGVAPDDPARGADYKVGSCTSSDPANPSGGSGGTGGPGGGSGGTGADGGTNAVALTGPARRTGAGAATLTGHVEPARAGVDVTVTRTAHGRSTSTLATTRADGSFTLTVLVGETSQLRAEAGGIHSQTVTITVRSKVRIRVRRSGTRILGTVDPHLPGRVLLLPVDSPTPAARGTVANGRFSLKVAKRRRGRFQVVYIPAGARAERATSNTITIR